LWQLALILHVDLQMGVARYNALYSGFGALPIFLVWVYVSWLVVLLAAELAASYQNEQVTRQRLRARDVDQSLEEAVALGLIAAASRAYLGQARRPSVATLSESFGAPPQTIASVAQSMVAGGLLATSSSDDGDATYLPARDIDRTRVSDVLAILRHRTHPIDAPPTIEIEVPSPIKRVLRQMGESAAMADANVTVRELVAEMERQREDG
jgi:membrane protein